MTRLGRLLTALLAVGLVAAARPTSAAEAAGRSARLRLIPDKDPSQQRCQVGIALDDTGVANWAYLNPRNPPYLFGQLPKPGEDPQDGGTSRAALELVRRVFAPKPPAPKEPVPTTPCGAVDILLVNRSTTQDLVVKMRLKVPVADGCPVDWKRAGEWCTLALRVPGTGSGEARIDALAMARAAGLASAAFLAKLDAALAMFDPAMSMPRDDASLPALVSVAEAYNGLPEATSRLPVSVPSRPELEERSGGRLPDARAKLVVELQEALRALPEEEARDLLLKALNELTAQPAMAFTVEPFGSAETLANDTGYFLLWPFLAEPASASALSSKVQTSLARDPALPDKPEDFWSELNPYTGERLEHLPASATLTVAQNLGNRAKASVTLRFRATDLGGAGDLSVNAAQYRLDTFNFSGVSAAVGRFQIANPTSGIAISETGDVVRLRYRWLSLARRFKRESAEGKANDANQDAYAWIATADNITLRQLAGLRSLNLIALWGRDRHPLDATSDTDGDGACDAGQPCPHSFSTLGGSLNFGLREARLGGSLGLYSSRRFETQGLPDGRGTTGLLTLSRTWGAPAKGDRTSFKIAHLLSASVGFGTGDRAGTALDEGYLGETASFAPDDTMFLGSLAGKIRIGTGADARLLPPGLSNKDYLGLTWETRLFSPLTPLARALGASEADIASQSLKLSWHVYRFREPIGGSRDAGQELVLSTDVATPPGVTLKLAYAHFFAKGALAPVFEHEPWALRASMTVSVP